MSAAVLRRTASRLGRLPFSLTLAAGVLGWLVLACGSASATDNGCGAGKSAAPVTGSNPEPAAGKLVDLTSYCYTLKLKGSGGPLADLGGAVAPTNAAATISMAVEGAYVKPDKGEMKMKLGSLEVGQTTIGRQQWVSSGGLTQGPTQISAPEAEDLSFAAQFWDEGLLPSTGKLTCANNRETVNGAATRKCAIDQATFEQLRRTAGGIFSAEESGIRDINRFAFETWLTDSGHPARLRIDMAGKDVNGKEFSIKVELDVRNMNSDRINIRPPSSD
jgi:hypothetical protein